MVVCAFSARAVALPRARAGVVGVGVGVGGGAACAAGCVGGGRGKVGCRQKRGANASCVVQRALCGGVTAAHLYNGGPGIMASGHGQQRAVTNTRALFSAHSIRPSVIHVCLQQWGQMKKLFHVRSPYGPQTTTSGSGKKGACLARSSPRHGSRLGNLWVGAWWGAQRHQQ